MTDAEARPGPTPPYSKTDWEEMDIACAAVATVHAKEITAMAERVIAWAKQRERLAAETGDWGHVGHLACIADLLRQVQV